MKLPTIPVDKANHLVWGALIAILSAALMAALGYAVLAGPAGMATAAVAGLVKEAVDWWSNRQAVRAGLPAPHTVEPLDVVATVLGGAVIYGAWATGISA